MGWVDPWVGLGQSADGLGWIGSHKMDPWTTLIRCLHFTAACTNGWVNCANKPSQAAHIGLHDKLLQPEAIFD